MLISSKNQVDKIVLEISKELDLPDYVGEEIKKMLFRQLREIINNREDVVIKLPKFGKMMYKMGAKKRLKIKLEREKNNEIID